MSSLSDEALARILQAEFDEEYQGGGNVTVSTRNTSDFTQVSPYSSMPSGSSSSSNSKPLSLIDREWELLDPTPDPRALFLQFNDKFFSGRLAGVEVRWSPRMTLCAGVCSYEGRGGLCSIRLSVPLLKLRPRKDLVETLLHEMIHAYLFVTQNNRDRDGHGPEFCKHKDRINKEAGTKITIYHSFHDEVENYRQHWWRCNGPCQERKPFFGYVKRAMNRAPSHNDTWWADHQRNCGGTFTKIKEPEGYSNKKRKKEANSKEETENETPEKKPKRESHDIRNFIPFGGQGQRLGGSDSTKVNGTSAGETYKPDVVEKENKNPALERGASHEGREQIRRKTLSNNDLGAGVGGSLVKNETDISPTGKANDKDHMQKTYNTKVKRKDSLTNCPNGKDIERRKKKLEELKAIFVSSSEDEDDENVDAYQEERKAGKAKEGVRKVSAVGCGGEAGIERSEDDDARERRKKMGGKDGEWLDGRTSSFSVPSVSGVRSGVGGAVGGAQVIDRGRNRGSSGKDTRDHSSGQNSLHQVVEKMKRVPGVTSGSSQGDAERTSGNEQPTVCCPVCGTRVTESQINGHLDSCLSG